MNINLILNKIDRNKNYIILVSVFVLAVLIRLKLLFINASYGQDASALASSLNQEYFRLFQNLKFFQAAPPFFMVTSKFILNLFSSYNSLELNDFILRIFPFICSVGSIFLFYFILKKMFSYNVFILFCLILFAFNPITITYGAQFKQYSTEILVTLIIIGMYYFLDIKSVTDKKLLLISLFTAISPWFAFSVYTIILPCYIIILADVIKNKFFDKKKFLILLLPLLISSCIFIFCYYIPVKNSYYAPMGENAKEHFMYVHKYLSFFWENSNPSFFTFDNFISLFQYKMENMLSFHLPKFGYLILIIINTLILFINKNYKLMCIIIVPFFITIMLSALKILPFEARIVSYLIPLIIILCCQFILIIKKEQQGKIFAAVILIYLLCVSYVKPIENYYLLSDYFNQRNILKELIKINPNLDNIISNSIITEWYIKKDLKYNDTSMRNGFANCGTSEYLKSEAESGEYWVAGVMNYPDYKNGLFHFINENKGKFEIIDLHLDEGTDNFILHLRKNN